MLARQAGGETLDVSRMVRPGIVGHGAVGASPWSVIQGAGRYEKVAPASYFDAFIDEAAPLPPGAIRLEHHVPADVVYAANVLSSRGAAGANPELVQFVTEGRTFQRVLFPARSLTASTSKVLHDIRQLEARLTAELGPQGLARRLPAGWQELAPVERLKALQAAA
jgi:hypothetical protein